MFKFTRPSLHIDWAALHALDLPHVIRNTDIDVLELFLDTVAHGDVHASGQDVVSPSDLEHLCCTSQLIVQYLLYVQNRLAAEACSLKTALAKASSKYDQMKTKALDYRSQTSSARTAVRQLKQEVRALEEELAAASHPIMPTPPPEVKIVEREVQVPVADPELVIKLQGLEGDIHSLLNQRKQAQRETHQLKETLAACMAHLKAVEEKAKDAIAEQQPQTSGHAQIKEQQEQRSSCTSLRAKGESSALRVELAKALDHARQMEKQKDILQLEIIDLLRDKQQEQRSPSPDTVSPRGTNIPTQSHRNQPEYSLPTALGALNQQKNKSIPIPSTRDAMAPAPPPRARPTQQPGSPPINRQAAPLGPETLSVPSPCVTPSSSRDISPTPYQKHQFQQELPHQLTTRPAVLGRFPHSTPSVDALIMDLRDELAAEVASGLVSMGVPPHVQGLTDDQAARCLEEMKRRRRTALAAMEERDRHRAEYMRKTIKWHIGEAIATGPRKRAPPQPTPPPIRTKPVPPIRTKPPQPAPQAVQPQQPIARRSAPQQGMMDKVIAETHDEAFYSPLRRSVPSPVHTPTAVASPAPTNTPETPSSPWSITHQRVLGATPPASPLQAGSQRLLNTLSRSLSGD